MTAYLFVHAHPDDETLASGALLVALAAAGHRCHVATATRGEKGEVVPGAYAHLEGTPGLVAVRERELAAALAALGVASHAFVGRPPARADGAPPRVYTDSGMRWVTPTLAGPGGDAGPDALTAATPAEVAADVAALARSVSADVLVSYADDGGYGHPDHVACHHATALAARSLGLPFEVIVTEADRPHDAWYDVSHHPAQVAAVVRAHAAYPTQLTVSGHDITHVGGQHQPMVLAAGLARR